MKLSKMIEMVENNIGELIAKAKDNAISIPLSIETKESTSWANPIKSKRERITTVKVGDKSFEFRR